MVRLGTLLTLGFLGIAVAGFIGLGGASGIGQRIGSGLSSGFSNFFGSFSQALSGNFANAEQGGQQNVTTAPTELTGLAPPIGVPQLLDNLQQTQGSLQGINNFFSNLFSGALFNPRAFRTAPSFTPEAITQRMKFSSLQSGTLRTTFGGFGSANAQESALQIAILESQRDNPSFFLRG